MNEGVLTVRVHPVLFEIPLPHWNISLTPWLLALSLFAVVVCELGRRSQSRDLLLLGALGCVVAVSAAAFHRGERIETGPIPVYSFGALLSSAVLVGWIATVRLARLDGLAEKPIAAACLSATVAGFLGARLLYVLANVKDFHSVGEAFAFQAGGLTFYGALAAGVFGSWWVLRRRDVSWPAFADAAAPGLALSSAIGRIGCYLAGCDYGTPLGPRAPQWLQRLGTFPRWPDEVAGTAAGSPAWVDQVLNRGLPLTAKASLPVHPVELYEAAASLAIFAGLLTARRVRQYRGQTFFALVLAYGTTRLFLESVRGDPERGILGPLSLSQWIALLSFAAVALGFRHRSRSRHTALPG